MGLMDSLGIGYSGLNASQVGINTTGHNIANAETDGYSRQRVVQSAANPVLTGPGSVGNGVEIQNIERIFDAFVFEKYTTAYSDKDNSDFKKKTLEELSTYFPEVDDVGIKADLKEFYTLWQRLADNPNSNATKIALAQQAQTLSQHIQEVHNQVFDMQKKLNEELKTNIEEVNKIAAQIAELNKSINKAESGGAYKANDLRDKRGVLERDLARLIGAKVSVGGISSNINLDSSASEEEGDYNLQVNGFNIVDGGSYHPIGIDNAESPDGFYQLYYERQDGVRIPFEQRVRGGKIGAILEMRGKRVDQNGMPQDGVIQNVYSQINAFATQLITSVNNIYAKSGTTSMTSNSLAFDATEPLVNSSDQIHTGTFDVVVYDSEGNEIARKEITIDQATTLNAATMPNGNSIEEQFISNNDDNQDGNANNDIDDMLLFYPPDPDTGNELQIAMKSQYRSEGYRFTIEDGLTDEAFSSGTNFAGALGLNRFFDGSDAGDIALHSPFVNDATKISAGGSEVSGDNSVALAMVQHQFEKYDFTINQDRYNDTIYGFFDMVVTQIGIEAKTAESVNETLTAQFNAVEQEYQSVSKVSIDEELTNLIKYQTAYGAAAKVITTVDQMLNTLLGIKQ